MTIPDASAQKKKRTKTISLFLNLIGLIFYFYSIYARIFMANTNAGMWWVLATLFLMLSLGYYATVKERSAAWGLMPLLPLFGPVIGFIVLLMPRMPKILSWVVVAAVIWVTLDWVILPEFLKAKKRSITRGASEHVASIHKALSDWYTSPNLGAGSFVSGVTDMGKDGRTFEQVNPKVASWLTSDFEYAYTYEYFIREDGTAVPKVIATATHPRNVCGEVILSLPDGKATVIKVSDSYSRWETSCLRKR